MKTTIYKKIIKKCYKNNFQNFTIGDIEIFSNFKYHDYYLRGQALPVFDPLYDLDINEDIPSVSGEYYFFIFVLVNDKYQKRLKYSSNGDQFTFSKFSGNTIEEFRRQQNHDNKYNIQYSNQNNFEFFIYDYGVDQEEIIQFPINKKDCEIKENTYLNKSIEDKKDIILLDMELVFDDIFDHFKDSESISKIPVNKKKEFEYIPKTYSFLAFNHSNYWSNLKFEYNNDLIRLKKGTWETDFMMTLYNLLDIQFDYNFLPTKNFFLILKDIGELAWEWIKRKKVRKKYLKYLNKVQLEMGDRDFPLTNFCYKFFDELVEDLIKEKQIIRCLFCGDYFKYQKGKKYCSLQSEGKDCGKRARNKRFYKDHKEAILPNARKTTRELREWYKEKGIKK